MVHRTQLVNVRGAYTVRQNEEINTAETLVPKPSTYTLHNYKKM